MPFSKREQEKFVPTLNVVEVKFVNSVKLALIEYYIFNNKIWSNNVRRHSHRL